MNQIKQQYLQIMRIKLRVIFQVDYSFTLYRLQIFSNFHHHQSKFLFLEVIRIYFYETEYITVPIQFIRIIPEFYHPIYFELIEILLLARLEHYKFIHIYHYYFNRLLLVDLFINRIVIRRNLSKLIFIYTDVFLFVIFMDDF